MNQTNNTKSYQPLPNIPADIEISQKAEMKPIQDIASKLNLNEEDLEVYGKYKAKLEDQSWERIKDRPDGKLILVTAVTPTPAGEGKTCTSIGLAQAFGKLGVEHALALREPSMGPTFGIKGRCSRRRLLSGVANGRHQHALHRRPACHCGCSQPARCRGGQLDAFR